MLCDFFGIGQQYQENYFSKYYQKLGHQVIIIASTFENINDYYLNNYDKKRLKSEQVIENIKLIRLPYFINFANKIRRYKGVYKILCEEKPDFIFVHNIHFNLNDAVSYKIKNKNCKIILDFHGDYSNSAKKWISLNIMHKLIWKPYLMHFKKYLNKIYGIVPEGIKFIHEVYGVDYSEIDLLPLGCDYDLANEIRENSSKIELKKKYNILLEDFVIITGGKLNPEKKTDILIDAMKLINKKNLHLIIFGAADKQNVDYEKELKNKSTGYNVHFTGWINSKSILELMNISDVAVFPASQSVMWQQAIGMHLPLIVGDSGLQDASYLNQNNNVIVLNKQRINVDSIRSVLLDLIRFPNKIKNMRDGAKKTAEQLLNYEIIVKKTLE